jgi:hypothetical protein
MSWRPSMGEVVKDWIKIENERFSAILAIENLAKH